MHIENKKEFMRTIKTKVVPEFKKHIWSDYHKERLANGDGAAILLRVDNLVYMIFVENKRVEIVLNQSYKYENYRHKFNFKTIDYKLDI